MESAAQRLHRAREALRVAEYGSSLTRPPPLGEKSGVTYHVEDGCTALVNALTDLLPARGWAGLLGVIDFDWETAIRAGLDLERVLTILDPKEKPARIVAFLTGFFDVVCIGEGLLNLRGRRILAAKTRSCQYTILMDQVWTGTSRPCGLPPSQTVAS